MRAGGHGKDSICLHTAPLSHFPITMDSMDLCTLRFMNFCVLVGKQQDCAQEHECVCQANYIPKCWQVKM